MSEASLAFRRPRYSTSRRLPGKVGLSAHQRNGGHGGVWPVASPTPVGVEVWQWRNVQLIAIAIPGGMGINPYLIYIPLNSRFPCSLEKVKKPGKNFCTYPVENFGSKRPKYRKNER
jgi:hypothetical protein